MKRNTTFSLALLLATLLTGCVGVLPVPPLSTEVLAGRKIERRDAKFIMPGTTTRREVEQRLGACTRRCSRPPAAAYSWETPCWMMHWWVAVPDAAFAENFPVGGWHALFVAFDDKGTVLQKEFVSLSHSASLDEHLERWAARVRASTAAHPAPASATP